MNKSFGIFSLIILSIAFLFGFYSAKPAKTSNVILDKTKIEKKADNRFVVHIPMASLPKQGRTLKKGLETVKGEPVKIPGNEADPSSKKIVVLISNNEKIVLTNIPYVHALELAYLGKKVNLKGNWRKNAVIYGKEYKSFWIEDIDLDK